MLITSTTAPLRPRWIRNLATAALAACLSLPACSTATCWVVETDYQGPVALVEEDGYVNPARRLGGEAATWICSIDGSEDAGRYLLAPGLHRFELKLDGMHHEFAGDVALVIPSGEFLLMSRLIDEEFEIRVRSFGRTRECSVCRVKAMPKSPDVHFALPLLLPCRF